MTEEGEAKRSDKHLASINIAEFSGCRLDQVWEAFFAEGSKLGQTNDYLDHVKEQTHALNKAVRYTENLLREMHRLSRPLREELVLRGAVTTAQLANLHKELSTDEAENNAFLADVDRTGGRNIPAHAIAEAIVRLFKLAGKKITFGQTAEGAPSTDFGRAVEFAMGEYGVRGDWRRPAEDAFRRQRQQKR